MTRVIGVHAIIYSRDPEADRAFLRDQLAFPSVDAGGGWLIFALPPAEAAFHPADASGAHELYLMVEDVRDFIATMASRGVRCTPAEELRWGVLTQVTLPSGAQLGVYQPRHPSPRWPSREPKPRKPSTRSRRPSPRRARPSKTARHR